MNIKTKYGDVYPVVRGIYKRSAQKVVVETCPYCGKQHVHDVLLNASNVSGFRISKCKAVTEWDSESISYGSSKSYDLSSHRRIYYIACPDVFNLGNEPNMRGLIEVYSRKTDESDKRMSLTLIENNNQFSNTIVYSAMDKQTHFSYELLLFGSKEQPYVRFIYELSKTDFREQRPGWVLDILTILLNMEPYTVKKTENSVAKQYNIEYYPDFKEIIYDIISIFESRIY